MKSSVVVDAIFTKSNQPKNSWQLLFWLIFEPTLLKKYSEGLSYQQRNIALIKSYPLIIGLCFIAYFLSSALIVSSEFPLLYPKVIDANLVLDPIPQTSFYHHYSVYIEQRILKFIVILLIGLLLAFIEFFVGGLVGGLIMALIFGVLGSFSIDLAAGLLEILLGEMVSGIDDSLTGVLTLGLIMGMIMGIALSLAMGLTIGLAFGFVFSLAFSIAGGGLFGLAIGVIFALVYGLGFYISYFRVLFYPFYCGFKMNFTCSPYHFDALVWLPIWKAKAKLCQLAVKNPPMAHQFIHFLHQYRPLQTELADYIGYAAHAGQWIQQPLLLETGLEPPETEKIKPSHNWIKQLAKLNQQYLKYHHHEQLNLKKSTLKELLIELEIFRLHTLIEDENWRPYYLQAIEVWKQASETMLRNLNSETHTLTPTFMTSLH